MSTSFDVDDPRSSESSRRRVILGSLVAVLALVAGFAGPPIYRMLACHTVVAYFTETNALYPGDDVRIMGAKVGSIDKIEPTGDKMKVTFHYATKYHVPADASAVILNPSLVASRNIRLEPPYTGGAVLADHAVIPVERTRVPVEWDTLRSDITDVITKLGPTAEHPKGPLGDAVEAFADGLAGKGAEINATLTNLSQAITALNEGRVDIFAVLRGLARFVEALHKNDQQLFAMNQDLAELTGRLTHSDGGVANAIQQLDALLPKLRPFLAKNRTVLTHGVNNLADVTTALVHPEPLDGLESALHVLPTVAANAINICHPAQGACVGLPILANVANWQEFICGVIQSYGRAGYQDSAELCAEYLAPVLDAIKFNYLPFGVNLFNTAKVLPKHINYSEPRLQPPPGYKDTTVPGIFVPDTPLSHRNTQPGWLTAPGMQGVKPGPDTARLLTPESLAELLGGPDIAPVESQYQTPPGPVNSYDQEPGPFPYVGAPGLLQAGPIAAPPPAPGVVPGPVPPMPRLPGAGQ